MNRTRRLAVGLIALVVVSACGGPAGSASPGDSRAGSGSGGRGMPPVEAPVIGLAALAEHDEWLLADGLEASGAAELMGPGLLAWLDDQRAAFMEGILTDNGIDASASIASIDGPPGPATALGLGGWTMAMAGAFVSTMGRNIAPSNGESVDYDTSATERGESTVDGRRGRAEMTMRLALHAAGSRIEGTIEMSINVTLLDADGRPTGTITIRSKATVEMDVCPDIDGGVNAHFETDAEVTASGSAGATGTYTVHTSGTASGNVGDDAYLHSLRVTGDSAMRSSGLQGGRTVDAAVHADGSYVLSNPGRIVSLGVDPAENAFGLDVTRDNQQATDREVLGLFEEVIGTGVIIAAMLFEAAQERWRGGACVRIDATEQSREVDPDEAVSFTAKPVHVVEGIDLKFPIVGTFNGVKKATPMDQEIEPPASFDFTAGPNPGDKGTISMKSTSRRGIGTLELVFTVKPPIVLEVEIVSTIRITMSAGMAADATAKASGRIRLVQDEATKRWSAMGSLSSVTTSGPVGCPAVILNGSGSYDWFIRELTATPGTTKVALWMDSGPATENPDTGVVDYCTFSTTGPVNTWENTFFLAHFGDFGAKGFGISSWSVLGVPEIWQTGGLLVETTWIEACDGPKAAPGASQITACSGTTTIRVWVVIPPPP